MADLARFPDLARTHRLSFAPATIAYGHFLGMPGTGNITAVAVADFTGDGKPDFLRAWYAPGVDGVVQLVVLPGKGDGALDRNELVTKTGCNSSPGQLAIADLDGDNRLDVLAGDCGMTAGIFYGRGDGTFKTGALSAALQSPVVGDFDGDGKLDVAGFSALGVVRLAWPQPDGSLTPGPEITVSGQPRNLVAADLNGDNRADLVMTTPGTGGMPDRIQVLLGEANQTFKALPVAVAGTAVTCAVAAVADLDRDGRADLVLRDAVLPGRGDGTFAAALPFPESGYCPAAIADFDGDGILDVSAGPELNAQGIDQSRAYLRLGHGDGRFDPVVGFDAPQIFQIHRFGAPRAADWNSDGKPDIFGVYGGFESDGVITMINTSN